MSTSDPVQTLPPYLVETGEMIRAAFPDGIAEEAYGPLLTLLLEGMSFRTLARSVPTVLAGPMAGSTSTCWAWNRQAPLRRVSPPLMT